MHVASSHPAREFYHLQASQISLLQIWLGYKQSLRPCETGLTLNLDMATTAFLSADPVLEFLRNSLRCSLDDLLCNDDRILQKANRALRNLRVCLSPLFSSCAPSLSIEFLLAEARTASASKEIPFTSCCNDEPTSKILHFCFGYKLSQAGGFKHQCIILSCNLAGDNQSHRI